MARPFEIALEDAVIEESEQQELIDVSDVIEETAIAEEEAEENLEIDTQIEAIDEASEEADAMLDQSEVNETKIEAAEQAADSAGGEDTEDGQAAIDENITEEDIVVSEENLKYSIIRFGCDDDLKRNLELSMEARANKKSRLARLKVAQEGVVDFIAKVVSTIRTLIAKVVANIKKFFAKLSLRFGGYIKKANALIEKFKGMGDKATLSEEGMAAVAGQYVKNNLALCVYDRDPSIADSGGNQYNAKDTIAIFSDFANIANDYVSKFYADEDAVATGGLFSKFKNVITKFRRNVPRTKDEEASKTLLEELGADSKDNILILGYTGNNINYVLNNGPKGIVVKSFDVKDRVNIDEVTKQETANMKPEIDIKGEVIPALNDVVSNVKKAKDVFKSFDKAESDYIKSLDTAKKFYEKIDKDPAAGRRLKIALDVVKVCATNLNLFLIRDYVSGIKKDVMHYNTLANELGKNKA